MKLRKAFSWFLTLFLSAALATPAHADDGKICAGLAILLCAPVAVVALTIDALTPEAKVTKVWRAVDNRDLATFKRLMQRSDDLPTPNELNGLLSSASRYYVYESDPAKEAQLLGIVQYLLENTAIDMSGAAGRELLQEIVNVESPVEKQPADHVKQKRTALIKLAIAHGACARCVVLSKCHDCDLGGEFLSLMVEQGADPNARNDARMALLDLLIESDNFDAAEQLIRLGADPNGSGWADQGMLANIAGTSNDTRDCDGGRLSKDSARWQTCVAQSVARTRFAITHGADPNGKTTVANGCVTPYEVAKSRQNEALAQTLLELGASPDFGAQCRQTAPAR